MTVLIFTGGESPDIDVVTPFFKNLQIEYLIAADSGLDTYEKYLNAKLINKTPDFLVGDFDSISDKTLVSKYHCEKKIYSHDKDWTDSELALIKAREIAGDKGTIILCGGSGGRPDHFMALYDSFSKQNHADIWLCGEQVIWYCGYKSYMEIDNVTFEDRISISRISSEYENTNLICKGLEWNNLFTKGMPSLSNRISKEYFENKKTITLKAEKGSFLVYTPFTAKVTISSFCEN